MAELSDSLFGVEGQGWVWVQSDQPILGLEIYGDRLHGGLASLTACQAARSLIAPHVVQGSSWWSGIALANPGEEELNITLTLREDNGEMGSQWQGVLPGHGRVVGLIETLFPKISSCNGWIDVSASGELAGLLTLGYEKEGIQPDLAATELTEPNEILRLPVLSSDDAWWTGVAITNPHRATALVDLKTYSEEGEIVGSRQTTMGPEQKVSGLASSLLAVPVRGWMEVKSDVPLAGMELLCLQQGPGSGLVALSGATPHEEIFFPHLALSDRWWTQLALCHPLSSVSCQGVLGVVESDGVVLGCRAFDLDKKCVTFQDPRDLMEGQ
jgi:hypothetical protein